VKRLAIPAFALILLASAGTGFAQTLAITTNKTVVDGVVNPSEYSFSKDFKKLVLYINRTSDALYVAVVGNTKGWVAFGLGSLLMNGSTIFMGYVKNDGTAQFKPQAGKNHTHQDTTKAVADTIVAYAMKEADGKTTLEVELKPASYITSGQSELDVIYAEGTEKSFLPIHMFRGSLAVKFAG
jgi:hypothetical protein